MKRTGSTNSHLRKLISLLKKQERPLWHAVAEELEGPSRKRPHVNLYKIDKYTNDGDIVVVPGKVLGIGKLSHKVTVIALDFSASALNKIRKSGSNALPLTEGINAINKGSYCELMKG